MNDAWLEDTTDVLHCSMPPQVRAHIEELRDEIARLRAAEVPLSANVGFARVVDLTVRRYIRGEGSDDQPYISADDAQGERIDDNEFVVALIPVTAWDRT